MIIGCGFMFLPKIKFREMTVEENIETIKWAYYENNGDLSVHDYTIEYFPELAVFDANTPKEIVYKKIEEVVANEYSQYEERIKNETKRYNTIWKKYNDEYFLLLSNFLNVKWPEIKIIEGRVGLIPVFPRYLDECSFSVGAGFQDWFLIKTTAHESLHFIWFQKWKEMHPEIPRREYDSPYISWKYSEMVTDPILNNKPFCNLFGNIFIEKGYDSFYEIKDGDNLVMDVLRDIYSKDISIEEKINQGFEYINIILNNKVNERIAKK